MNINACSKSDNTEKIVNKNNVKKSDNIGVVIIDRAVLRVDPMLYSSVVSYINKGEKIEVTNRSRKKTWIGNVHDYWYKINLSKGFSGWTFGTNLKIFPADKTRAINNFLAEFWEEEIKKFRRRLRGKWGIVEISGRFPNQYLIIYDNGKYASFSMDSAAIEGRYSVNFQNSEIVFNNGTYFGTRIDFAVRQNRLYLIKENKNSEIKFKKISSKVDSADINDKNIIEGVSSKA
jgi:hypothetical protein